jgi:hypothetical protein
MKNEFRKSYDKLKKDVIDVIITFMKAAPDGHIQLNDKRGSLCYQVIDDQESEVIQSLELSKPDEIVAWIGVYDEDYTIDIENFEIPFLLNILEALEKALEEDGII